MQIPITSYISSGGGGGAGVPPPAAPAAAAVSVASGLPPQDYVVDGSVRDSSEESSGRLQRQSSIPPLAPEYHDPYSIGGSIASSSASVLPPPIEAVAPSYVSAVVSGLQISSASASSSIPPSRDPLQPVAPNAAAAAPSPLIPPQGQVLPPPQPLPTGGPPGGGLAAAAAAAMASSTTSQLDEQPSDFSTEGGVGGVLQQTSSSLATNQSPSIPGELLVERLEEISIQQGSTYGSDLDQDR